VKAASGRTVIRVDLEFVPNLIVQSSSVCGHPPCSGWPDPLKKAIDKRSAEGGADKGRIFYLTQRQWPSQSTSVVAALLFHVSDYVFRVTQLGATTDRHASQRRVDFTTLLLCAEQVAIALGLDRVEWLVHTDSAARAACSNHSFRRVRRTSSRCKSLRANEILLEKLVARRLQ
jgi:hypothetical protein